MSFNVSVGRCSMKFIECFSDDFPGFPPDFLRVSPNSPPELPPNFPENGPQICLTKSFHEMNKKTDVYSE